MAASMKQPLVVILGATGTGKTKLSLELGRLFNGEIISADSMQVYKGLDIITNKATPEEQQICPHHLIDYLSPLKENNTVVDFRNAALPIIDSLLGEKKLPIVVGGTNYYIESLLWKYLVENEDVKKAKSLEEQQPRKFPKLEGVKSYGCDFGAKSSPEAVNETESPESIDAAKSPESIDEAIDEAESPESIDAAKSPESIDVADDSREADSERCFGKEEVEARFEGGEEAPGMEMRGDREKYEALSNAELHQRLMEVDREYAWRTHPNNRRKIVRALEVFDRHGVPLTEVHRAQHTSQDSLNGPLRYPNTCVFWLTCDKQVLGERLDRRVDAMIDQGLVEELTSFHQQYNQQRLREGREADYTTGIFQSIGFKEFHGYLILNDEERQTAEGKKKLEEGIQNLKTATRQYAKYQIKWVRSRLLRRPGPEDQVPAVYGLDCTDVSRWEETVATPAHHILEAIIKGERPPIGPLPRDGSKREEFVFRRCVPCDMTFVTTKEWEAHQKSKKHRHVVRKYKKKMQNLARNLDNHVQQQKKLSDETPALKES